MAYEACAERLDVKTYSARETHELGRRLGEWLGPGDVVALIGELAAGKTVFTQVGAKPATANDLTLFALAKRALVLAWTRRVRIRHMRLICGRLTFPPAQLSLFPASHRENQKRDNLIVAIDRIRQRFGRDVVRMGRTLAA